MRDPRKAERFFYTLLDKEVPLTSYSSLFTALTSFFSTIIVIPVTITQYLFNRQEDSFIAKILKFSATYNEEVRKAALEAQKQFDNSVSSTEAVMDDAAKALDAHSQENSSSTASQDPESDEKLYRSPDENVNEHPRMTRKIE